MTPSVLESTERRLPPPTRDRVVWVWAAASFFAFAGDSIWFVGLAWAAVNVASPGVAGVVVAVGMVPQAVLLLVGGSLADRLDTRVVMVTANAVRVLTLLVGAVLWQADVAPVPLLIVVACVFGAADAFYLPAGSTMPRQMVHPEDLATLGGLFQVVRRAAVFAGSALGGAFGGAIVAWGGLAPLGLGGAALLLLSLVLLYLSGRIRPRAPAAAAEAVAPSAAA